MVCIAIPFILFIPETLHTQVAAWRKNGIIMFLILSGCMTNPALSTKAIPVVPDVDLNKYPGTWYELAGLPNSFEKGLFNITATYSLLGNGKVRVLNEGNRETKPENRQNLS